MIFKLDRRVNWSFCLLNEAGSTVADKHGNGSKMKQKEGDNEKFNYWKCM